MLQIEYEISSPIQRLCVNLSELNLNMDQIVRSRHSTPPIISLQIKRGRSRWWTLQSVSIPFSDPAINHPFVSLPAVHWHILLRLIVIMGL